MGSGPMKEQRLVLREQHQLGRRGRTVQVAGISPPEQHKHTPGILEAYRFNPTGQENKQLGRA